MKNFSVQKWTSKDWGVDLNRIAIREKEKDTLQVSEKDLIFDQFFTQHKEMFRDRSRLHLRAYQHHVVKIVDKMMVK